jgi:2-dehydro-3-deoxyglucarate aldolase/4-hydroxy-2-oxoheptanedioate aldolase
MKRTLKEKMEHGDFVLGTMLSEVATPNIARVLSACGFEFIIIDCEHGYFDHSQTAAILAVANGAGLSTIVRMPQASRELITKYLDMGANGLLLPMTSTSEQIKEVVRYAKYSPMGERGISTQRAHTNYNPPPLQEYMAEANRRTILFAQIETREGIANIDAILSVEGVDGALIGPNDLACDYGAPGILDNPAMAAGIDIVIAAAKRAGRSCGIISGKVPLLQKWREKGMTILSCNSEVGMIMEAGKRIVNTFHSE